MTYRAERRGESDDEDEEETRDEGNEEMVGVS